MQVTKGIYENGVIYPFDDIQIKGKKYVIITFLDETEFSLPESPEDLKPIIFSQFSALEPDWNAEGMDKYDRL